MTSERKQALIAEVVARVEETLAGRLDALGERSLTLDEIEDLVEGSGAGSERLVGRTAD